MNALIAVATAEDGTNPGASVRLSDRFHPLNDLEGGTAAILKPHRPARPSPAHHPPGTRRPETDGPRGSRAWSAPFGKRGQELGGRLDWDLAPLPEVEEVTIAGNDGDHIAGRRRFQDPVVGGVCGDLGDNRGRLDDGRDPGELGYGLLDPCRLPAELRLQYRSQLGQQSPGADQLNPLLEHQAVDELGATAWEDESRYQDVGVEDDSQPPRASWISRSTSLSSRTPTTRAREAPYRWSDSNTPVSRCAR